MANRFSLFQNIIVLTFTYCCIQDGFTPLAVALQQCHTRVVELLLGNGTKDDDQPSAFHIAAMKGDTKSAVLPPKDTQTKADFQIKVGYSGLQNYDLYTLL